MVGLPAFSELADVPTSFGTVRAYRFDGPSSALDTPVLALIAGRSVIHEAARAAERARNLLPRG